MSIWKVKRGDHVWSVYCNHLVKSEVLGGPHEISSVCGWLDGKMGLKVRFGVDDSRRSFPIEDFCCTLEEARDRWPNARHVSPRPEPSELVWEVNEPETYAVAEDPNFLYCVDIEYGGFSVKHRELRDSMHDGAFDDKTVVGGKAAVHAWRVKFLEGMTGGAKP